MNKDKETFVRLLRALDEAKDAFPGLRVGQLIENAMLDWGNGAGSIYYISDEDLLCVVEAYTAKHRKLAKRKN